MKKLARILAVALFASSVTVPAAAVAQSSGGFFEWLNKRHDKPSLDAGDLKSQKEKGRETFAAVHFMVGEKADKLTVLRNIRRSSDFDYEANGAFATEVMDAIEKDQPSFFESYHKDMGSGNPVVVEGAIVRGHESVTRYLKSKHPELLPEGKMTPQVCTIGGIGCVWTFGVVWNYGAAVNIGLAVIAYVVLWGPDKTWSPIAEDTAKLQRQTMIATLTKELHEP